MTAPNLAKRIGEPSRHCGKCHRDLPCTAKYFRPRHDRPSGLAYTCRDCTRLNQKDSTKSRRPYKGNRCFACEGMPWRRPKHRACACGDKYAPEPPKTIEDAMSERRDYSRVTAL
jgi:hypothetical protein